MISSPPTAQTAAPPLRAPAASVESGSDRALIEALVAGKPEAGELLYDRLIRIVEWTVQRVLGRDRIDHEDVVQSAFEQIVITLYRDSFARTCSLTSWACAVASRVALTELRASKRRVRGLGHAVDVWEVGVATELPDAERLAVARQDLERVRTALAQLKPDTAEILILYELGELPLADIARTLRLSETAVQSRLSRGRKELLERMEALPGRTP